MKHGQRKLQVIGIVCDPPNDDISLPHWPQQMQQITSSFSNDELEWRYVHVYDCREQLPAFPSDAAAVSAWVDAIVVSGSVYNITDCEKYSWMQDTMLWIRDAIFIWKLPVFGICFGHQLLATILGGVVGNNPNGPELGTVELYAHPTKEEGESAVPLTSVFNDLFHCGGGAGRLLVQETHSQCVLAVPPGAASLFGSTKDANQVLEYSSPRGVFSVQYHPEYSSSFMKSLLSDAEPVFSITEASDAAVNSVCAFLKWVAETGPGAC